MKHIRDFVAGGRNAGGWQDYHVRAVRYSYTPPADDRVEAQMIRAIGAWCDYAAAHARTYGSKIGDDYVLGPAWARWGFALRDLLIGDLGRLDGGTLDTIIHDNLKEQGFDPDLGAP